MRRIPEAQWIRVSTALGLTVDSEMRAVSRCPSCDDARSQDEEEDDGGPEGRLRWYRVPGGWQATCERCGATETDAAHHIGAGRCAEEVGTLRSFEEVWAEGADIRMRHGRDDAERRGGLRDIFPILASEPLDLREQHVDLICETSDGAVSRTKVGAWLADWKRQQEPERIAPVVPIRRGEPDIPDADAPPPEDGWAEALRMERDSDVELARILVADLRDGDAPLVYDEGRFWRYEAGSGHWREMSRAEASRKVMTYDGRRVITGRDQHGNPLYETLSLRAARVSGCLCLAEAQCSQPGFFASAPYGVAFRNADVTATADGVVIQEPSWELRRRSVLQYDYQPDAECPRWWQFLGEVLVYDRDADNTAKALQEFAGAALVGLATSYAKTLALVGAGANGKSVLLEVLSALFPAEMRCSLSPQDCDTQFRLSGLVGKRLNVVNELPAADVSGAERWKAIVAGNEVTAEYKHKDPFTFRPIAAHIFAANDLPSTRDYSDGYWRRWIVVRFGRQFAEAEQDKGLAQRLIDTELPGIARWALEGAVRLQSQGKFTSSETTTEALRAWRIESDPVLAWAEDCLEADLGGGTPSLELYRHYSEWVKERGHMALAIVMWTRRMESQRWVRRKAHGVMRWNARVRPRHVGGGES